MTNPTSRNEWIFGQCRNVMDDKDALIKQLVLQMLYKTTQMFEYKNLPDTIDVKDLETQLQVGGYNIWIKKDDKLYCFNGGLGGEPNPYYLPTKAVVANPALPSFNGTYTIDSDCVVILNDIYYQGMMTLYNKYATLLAEAEISLMYSLWLTRTPNIAIADNDNTFKSAEIYFDRIKQGKGLGSVITNDFFEGLKAVELQKDSKITDIIEATQYIKGSWFNEVGINAAFNMKREALNKAEATLNDDVLIPIVDMMLDCRKKGIERVNKMYGTDISVEMSSVWKQNRKQEELELNLMEAEVEATEADTTEAEVDDNESTDTNT